MTREEVYNMALSKMKDHKILLLELATGYGKTALSIKLANYIIDNSYKNKLNILILVAKTVHKQNWLDEIKKWGGFHKSPEVTIECYESLRKYEGSEFDIVIADEAHHLNSEMRIEYFKSLTVKEKVIMLSATVPDSMKKWLYHTGVFAEVKVSLQDAITENVLPEPEIMLLALTLDNKAKSETIEINPKVRGKVYRDDIKTFWKYKKERKHTIFSATQQEKLEWFNSEILYWKRVYERTHNDIAKFTWLKKCKDRLQYLSYCKNSFLLNVLKKLQDKRTLTFCSDILQTEILGKYCIHSQNKRSVNTLSRFNEGNINHITTCQMLNEGVNLRSCQYAIFANLSSSKVVSVQRVGRALRHKHPKIIIPYYINSREEEIVNEMLSSYDKKLISTYKVSQK